MEKKDIIWLAGFFDGEGTLIPIKKNKSWQLGMAIYQSEKRGREWIEKYRAFFGGGIYRIKGSLIKHKNGTEFTGGAVLCWRIYKRSDCIKLLTAILPHLKIRKHDGQGYLRRLKMIPENLLRWTDREIEFVKRNTATMTVEQIAKKLKRSRKAIQHKIYD